MQCYCITAELAAARKDLKYITNVFIPTATNVAQKQWEMLQSYSVLLQLQRKRLAKNSVFLFSVDIL